MKYIKKAFGVNGDLTAIPDDIQSDGSVSYDTGWTDLYQRNPATDPTAKRISRTKHNQLFYDITSNTKLWQEQTFPEWIADKGDGTPFAYGKDAMVRYLDDFVYVSLEYNNTDVPSDSSKWIKFKDFGSINIHSLTSKTTPVDLDELVIADSVTSFNLKKLTWANLKATLLTYFDTLYSRTSAIFGISQTLQDVTASRNAGVTYTNTTGKPIKITVSTDLTGSNLSSGIELYVNGIRTQIWRQGMPTSAQQAGYVSDIVPNNIDYKFVYLGSSSAGINKVIELR